MKKTTLSILASLPLITPLLQAVSVSTAPVGFINLTINGTGSGSGLTGVSVPMLPQVLYSGVVSQAAGDKITDSSATWTADKYTAVDNNGIASYYVEITNNPNDDTVNGTLLDIYGTSDTGELTFNQNVDSLDLVGASYVIRQYRTLGGTFGDDTQGDVALALGAGANFTEADVIYKIGVVDTQTGQLGWQTYFYKSASFFDPSEGWRLIGDTDNKDMTNVIIRPNEGLIVRRRQDASVTLTLAGTIKTNASKTAIYNGYNLVAVSYPVDSQLGQLNLYNADGSLLTAGADSTVADRIYYPNDAGGFDIYFYKSATFFDPSEGWRKTGEDADQSSAVLKAGRPLVIQRRADKLAWSISAPF